MNNENLKRLRYQISDWAQATKCLSNNSKELHILIANYMHNSSFEGRILSVVHARFGTMFAAVVDGQGLMLSVTDEDGNDLPLLTTAQVLQQLEKFGFDIKYEEEPNLSGEQLTFLMKLIDLGYDAITKVRVKYPKTTRIQTIAYNSAKHVDYLSFNSLVSKAAFDESLEDGSAVNIAKMDTTLEWDWLTYTCQIQDILDANSVVHHIDERSPVVPKDDELTTVIEGKPAAPTDPSAFHVYGSVDILGDEDEVSESTAD